MALSGGPDSTALLLLLRDLADGRGWDLAAGHFDHGIRSGGAERVARLRGALADLEIRLIAGGPGRPVGRDHAALRTARYAWLRRTAREVEADRIATGHQRDDQAETVLFRILRGTGHRGLAGIPERRGPIVRPFLGFDRSEIARWLAERADRPPGLPFDDPANRDARYARSRLRHDLLPALRAEAGSGVVGAFLDIAEAARDVRRTMRPVARRALAAFADGSAAAWPVEIRSEALRLAARREGVRLRGSAVRTAAARMLDLASGQGFDLGGGLRLERIFEGWEVRRPGPPPPADVTLEIPGPYGGSGTVVLGGCEQLIHWGPLPAPARSGTRVALRVSGDHFPLVVRARLPGDRMRLERGGRKLARLMGEIRLPRYERDTVPIVADRRGRILCALARPLADRVDRDAATGANFMIEVEDG